MTATIKGSETWGSNTDDWAMRVRVMKEAGADAYYRDKAFNALSDSLNQIYYNTDIVGIDLQAWDTDEVLECDDRTNDGAFYLSSHDFSGPGLYLWVTTCSDSFAWNGAWESRTQAFVSQSDYSGGKFDAVAVQETLHSFIYSNCTYVENMIVDDEHELGEVIYEDGWDKMTPMAASYYDQHAPDGDCDRWPNGFNSYTTTVTSCTLDSLEYSRDHAKFDGSH